MCSCGTGSSINQFWDMICVHVERGGGALLAKKSIPGQYNFNSNFSFYSNEWTWKTILVVLPTDSRLHDIHLICSLWRFAYKQEYIASGQHKFKSPATRKTSFEVWIAIQISSKN